MAASRARAPRPGAVPVAAAAVTAPSLLGGLGTRQLSVLRRTAPPLAGRRRSGKPPGAWWAPGRRRRLAGDDGAGCAARPAQRADRRRRRPSAAPSGLRRRRLPSPGPSAPDGPIGAARRRSAWSGPATPVGPLGRERSGRSGRQAVAALRPPGLENGPAGPGGHAVAEAVVLGPLAVVGLVGALHCVAPSGRSGPVPRGVTAAV